MANSLDEETGPINAAGRDVHVINKHITVTIGAEALILEIGIWVFGFILGGICWAALPPKQAFIGIAVGGFPWDYVSFYEDRS